MFQSLFQRSEPQLGRCEIWPPMDLGNTEFLSQTH
jgi:hypothetical protein